MFVMACRSLVQAIEMFECHYAMCILSVHVVGLVK